MASKKRKKSENLETTVEEMENKIEDIKEENVEGKEIENNEEKNPIKTNDSTQIISTIKGNDEIGNEATKVIPIIKDTDSKEEEKEEKIEKEEDGDIETLKENKEEPSKKVEKESKKKEELPEYAKKLIKKQERKNKIIIYTMIIILFIALFSTIFSIINISKITMVKGVNVNGVDISGLTKKEAIEKLNKLYELEEMQEIIIKYEDYTTSIKPTEIQLKHNVGKLVEEAYKIGRRENILVSNYEILLTAIFSKNIKEDFSYEEDTFNNLISNISLKIPGVVVEPSYYISDSNELIITKGKDGLKAQEEELKKLILKQMTDMNYNDLINEEKAEIKIPVKEAKAMEIDIEKIREEIYKEPKNAELILEPFQIVPEENGVDFNISIEEAQNIVNGEGEEYKIPLKITPAEKTVKDLGKEAFPDILGDASTKYDSTNRDRTTNLQIAVNKINGTVLMPGETFSYNAVVGPRTVANGFKNAKIYSNGEVVDGLGGGICQISSTLYNAVLKANLEIVERRNHSFTTSYLPAGKDATVVYGVQDFKFKNNRQYPVKVQANCRAGIVNIGISGLKEEVEYTINIKPVVTKTIPYKTEYINDSTLEEGREVIVQKGANGCKVTTYKQVLLNGEQVSYEPITYDTYNAMKKIVKVGTKKVSTPVQNTVVDESANIESD